MGGLRFGGIDLNKRKGRKLQCLLPDNHFWECKLDS